MARRPVWLWPNLLSLDAPLVALAWFWIFKKTWLIRYYHDLLPWLLAVVVWCVCVADRLLAERMAVMGSRHQTPRHAFHGRWRAPFSVLLVAGILAAVVMVLYQPIGLWKNAAFIVLLVAGYFAMAFLESGGGVSYTKHILAGLAFGYGATVGLHFYGPDSSDIRSFIGSREVIAFSVLCILNITAIDHWEQSRRTRDTGEKEAYETLLALLLIVLAGFSLFLAAFRADAYRRHFFYAIMIAAGSLQLINHYRSRFSLDALRVLADVAMLLPVPVFHLMVEFQQE